MQQFIDQFHEAFLEVDFINVFGTYQDTVEAKLQTVERLSKELEEMGVLDIDKLEYRKQAQLEAEEEARDNHVQRNDNLRKAANRSINQSRDRDTRRCSTVT